MAFTLQNFLQDQYSATDQTRCIKIYIPDDDSYMPLLGGLLALAGNAANYAEPESAQAEGVAAVWKDAYVQTDWGGCGTPPECQHVDSEIEVSMLNFLVDTGNAIAITISTSQRNAYVGQQNPALNGQIVEAFRYMAAGTWSYAITCVKAANAGILTFQVVDPDSTIHSVGTHDFYNASTVFNFRFTGTFTLNESGLAKFHFGTSGKHASSSSYVQQITCLECWRTGD